MTTLHPAPQSGDPAAAAPPTSPAKPRRSLSSRLGGREGVVGLAIIVVLILIGVFAPVIAPHSPETIQGKLIMSPPSLANPFGTDDLGRDVFSRVLYAYRTSLGIAIGSVLLAMLVGLPVGIIAGYIGSWTDLVLMRVIDLLLSFPALLLAISLIAILGPGSGVAMLAIAIIYVPIMARVVRSSVLVVRGRPYVRGARARGASHLSILRGHVIPNAIGPALVQASVLMAFAILIEASLSFLGLGAQPPTPELGLMLADGDNYLTQAPWIEIFPGIAIALSVLGFNLIGDALRRSFDPNGVAE